MTKRTYFTTASLLFLAVAIFFSIPTAPAQAQSASCTSLTVGAVQNITAHGVCRRVTLNSVPAAGAASICVPTNTTAAEWASFYNNPPAGVSIAACAASCPSGGYYYQGYCYYANTANTESCDTTCAAYGGCFAGGGRFIGSDDSGSSRCSAVATALSGTPVSANPTTGTQAGCSISSLKGGWIATNSYSPATTCAASATGRACACASANMCVSGYSFSDPNTNRTYTAGLWRTERIQVGSTASIYVYGVNGACNPQPRYNHPFYIQVVRVSDGAVMYQQSQGAYSTFGACWSGAEATINGTLAAGTYEIRMYMQQTCTDNTRCQWGLNASLSC